MQPKVLFWGTEKLTSGTGRQVELLWPREPGLQEVGTGRWPCLHRSTHGWTWDSKSFHLHGSQRGNSNGSSQLHSPKGRSVGEKHKNHQRETSKSHPIPSSTTAGLEGKDLGLPSTCAPSWKHPWPGNWTSLTLQNGYHGWHIVKMGFTANVHGRGASESGAAEEQPAGSDTPFLKLHGCVPQDTCHGTGGLQLRHVALDSSI